MAFTRQAALVVWLVCGIFVLLCVPSARGSASLGATLPFWLVVAPVLNLVWLERAVLSSDLRRRFYLVRTRRRSTPMRQSRADDTMRRRVRQRT